MNGGDKTRVGFFRAIIVNIVYRKMQQLGHDLIQYWHMQQLGQLYNSGICHNKTSSHRLQYRVQDKLYLDSHTAHKQKQYPVTCQAFRVAQFIKHIPPR